MIAKVKGGQGVHLLIPGLQSFLYAARNFLIRRVNTGDYCDTTGQCSVELKFPRQTYFGIQVHQ